MKTKYTPEYLSNALVKPKAKTNQPITQGFFYAWQEEKSVVLFTKFICAN